MFKVNAIIRGLEQSAGGRGHIPNPWVLIRDRDRCDSPAHIGWTDGTPGEVFHPRVRNGRLGFAVFTLGKNVGGYHYQQQESEAGNKEFRSAHRCSPWEAELQKKATHIN